MPEDGCTIWFNPACSKCRGAKELLEERGARVSYFHYLDERPTRADLEEVLARLRTSDPRAMMRTGEARYRELGLATADRDALLEAMVSHPVLIERPIVIVGDRAVVARPPERLLELFA